jgi:hypothetical protein
VFSPAAHHSLLDNFQTCRTQTKIPDNRGYIFTHVRMHALSYAHTMRTTTRRANADACWRNLVHRGAAIIKTNAAEAPTKRTKTDRDTTPKPQKSDNTPTTTTTNPPTDQQRQGRQNNEGNTNIAAFLAHTKYTHAAILQGPTLCGRTCSKFTVELSRSLPTSKSTFKGGFAASAATHREACRLAGALMEGFSSAVVRMLRSRYTLAVSDSSTPPPPPPAPNASHQNVKRGGDAASKNGSPTTQLSDRPALHRSTSAPLSPNLKARWQAMTSAASSETTGASMASDRDERARALCVD